MPAIPAGRLAKAPLAQRLAVRLAHCCCFWLATSWLMRACRQSDRTTIATAGTPAPPAPARRRSNAAAAEGFARQCPGPTKGKSKTGWRRSDFELQEQDRRVQSRSIRLNRHPTSAAAGRRRQTAGATASVAASRLNSSSSRPRAADRRPSIARHRANCPQLVRATRAVKA